jgi:hypothetical protein
MNIDNYSATVVDNLITIQDGKFILNNSYYYAKTAVLFNYGGVKLLKEFEVISMDMNPSISVTQTSYSLDSTSGTGPFELTLGTTYKDELSDANAVENQARWFKFSVEKSAIYKLVYVLNTNESPNIHPAKPSDIVYNLYSKNTEGTLLKIGSKAFNPAETFTLDLALQKDKEYYLEFKTSDDLWTVQYLVSLLGEEESTHTALYQGLLTMDDNGLISQDIILPIFDTYEISVLSDKVFEVEFEDNSQNDRDEFNLTKTFYT